MTLDLGADVDSLPTQIVSYYLKGHADYKTWLVPDESVLEAFWQGGKDIGNEAVFVEPAESVGTDGEGVASALGDETLRAEVRERFSEAQQHGVTGIPTFVYEGYAA